MKKVMLSKNIESVKRKNRRNVYSNTTNIRKKTSFNLIINIKLIKKRYNCATFTKIIFFFHSI